MYKDLGVLQKMPQLFSIAGQIIYFVTLVAGRTGQVVLNYTARQASRCLRLQQNQQLWWSSNYSECSYEQ